MSDTDDKFYDRADEYIDLANKQISEKSNAADVSASFLYSASRFNAWISAANFKSGKEMAEVKDEIIHLKAHPPSFT
ncbi:MAG: DUF3144 domain-containing protein [Cocleimonas sp.]|nr:DUF3144 domain-containing protein [Cocleimonas sp.]